MNQVSCYQMAQENPSKRQGYLSSLQSQLPNSVKAVVYDPDWSYLYKDMEAMANKGYIDKTEVEKVKHMKIKAPMLIVFTRRMLGIKMSHEIFVSDKAFTSNENCFQISLFDHEVYHAQDLWNGLRVGSLVINQSNASRLQDNTVVALGEIRAYLNEMHQAERKGMYGTAYYDHIRYELGYFRTCLQSIEPVTDLEQKILWNLV